MFDLYREISELAGVSGDESKVAEYIQGKIDNSQIDPLGNVIAEIKGRVKPKQKIGIFAHMDEVGIMITHITKEGLLKFHSISVEPAVLHGRAVVIGEDKVKGIIGCKAYHHLSESERNTPVKVDDLFITIGAQSKEHAQEYVSIGDTGVFDEPFAVFGDNKLVSKALDDRLGCAIMLDLIKNDLPCDVTAVFTTMEEVGMRGATAAAYTADVDIAIILENTTAADVYAAAEDKKVCSLDNGAVVCCIDRGTIYNRELYKLGFETAEKIGVKVQTKEIVAGGNDSRAIMQSRSGVKVMAISVPCRYLHSASCVVSIDDIEAVKKLLRAVLEALV